MKKLTILLAVLLISAFTYGQESVYFIKKDASFNGQKNEQDTVELMDNKLIQFYNIASPDSGGVLVYEDGFTGDLREVLVWEEIGDSTQDFSSLSFTVSRSDTVDSIQIAGITVMGSAINISAAGGTDSLAGLLKDTLNALSAYTATVSGSVVTVTADTAGSAKNGSLLQIFGDFSTSQNFTGGRAARSANSALSAASVYQATLDSKTNYLSVDRTSGIKADETNDGCIIYYKRVSYREFRSTDGRALIRSRINAAP